MCECAFCPKAYAKLYFNLNLKNRSVPFVPIFAIVVNVAVSVKQEKKQRGKNVHSNI